MSAISCKVIDTRVNLPAAGMRVILRCMTPRADSTVFYADTNLEGHINCWIGYHSPNKNLRTFLETDNEVRRWQMGFLAFDFFGRDNICYTVVDVNFVLKLDQSVHISLQAGLTEYTTSVISWRYQQPALARPAVDTQRSARQYHKVSETQLKTLLAEYASNAYPSQAICSRLASDVDLTTKQIRAWYARQRLRDAKGKNPQVVSEQQFANSLIQTFDEGPIGPIAEPEPSTNIEVTTQLRVRYAECLKNFGKNGNDDVSPIVPNLNNLSLPQIVEEGGLSQDGRLDCDEITQAYNEEDTIVMDTSIAAEGHRRKLFFIGHLDDVLIVPQADGQLIEDTASLDSMDIDCTEGGSGVKAIEPQVLKKPIRRSDRKTRRPRSY